MGGFVFCAGKCVVGTNCSGCPNKFLCGSTGRCLAACATCADSFGKPLLIECVACDADQQNPIATCESDSGTSFCLNGDYSKAYHGGPGQRCDCSNTVVSSCPGPQQVCRTAAPNTDWCITCGEIGQLTDGMTCKNGKTCKTTHSPPGCL